MKNKTKLLLGAILISVVGLVIMFIGIFAGGRVGFYIGEQGIQSFDKQAGAVYHLEKKEIPSFTKAEIDIKFADLEIELSDGYYLEYKVGKGSSQPEYRVEDDKLIFRERDREGNGFGINFMSWGPIRFGGLSDSYYVKLYLPKDAYFEMISVQNAAGDVKVNELLAEAVEIDAKLGDIKIEELECNTVKVVLSAGGLEGNKITADSFQAENKLGDIEIKELCAKEAEMKLSAGELRVDSMDVIKVMAENKLGDIEMYLLNSIKDYDVDIETKLGDIETDYYQRSGMGNIKEHANKGKSISAYCKAGDVIIKER